jgi:hypothetical protein
MNGTAPTFTPTFCTNLLNAYEAAGQNLNVAARVEVCVNVRNATEVLINFDEDVLRQSLICIGAVHWWYVMWSSKPATLCSLFSRDSQQTRLHALSTVLSSINSSSREQRAHYQSVLLVAACVWMINGLHSCPADNSCSRELIKCILPLTIDLHNNRNLFIPNQSLDQIQKDYNTGVPHTRGSLIFLREMVWPPVASGVCFRVQRKLPGNTFQTLFEKSYSAVRHSLIPIGFHMRNDVPRTCFATRKTLTCMHDWDINFDPADASHPNLDTIEVLQDKMVYGPDDKEDAPAYSPPEESVGVTVDRLLTQFAADIIIKIGNPKGVYDSSYCPLPMYLRERLTLQELASTNIEHLFTKVQFKKASQEEWRKACGCIFPHSSHVTPASAQHWRVMKYYTEWKAFIPLLSTEDEVEVLEAVYEELHKLLWLPAATNDRLWYYVDRSKDGWDQLPGHSSGGPQVLVNPHVSGTLTLSQPTNQLNPAMALREEQEESSEDGMDE